MKKAIFMIMCFLCTAVYAQEQVFTIDNDGNIGIKANYIESYFVQKYKNTCPYIQMLNEKEKTLNGDSYAIECLKYRNWENDPGDMHLIRIRYQGKELFSLENNEGWEYITNEPNGDVKKTSFFYKINLDEESVALVFVGVYIMSQPPRLTIIVLKNGKASLVFDKPYYINQVTKNKNGIMLTLQANTVEYRDVGVPCNSPELHTLEFKNGMIYYK